MKILVFKTNLRFKKNIHAIGPHLESMEGVIKWNVDLHDKDKILRIEGKNISPRTVEQAIQDAGYFCEELAD